MLLYDAVRFHACKAENILAFKHAVVGVTVHRCVYDALLPYDSTRGRIREHQPRFCYRFSLNKSDLVTF